MLYIITAVHNRFNTTKQFVTYLKNQTYKDYTLVLVDDGSTDGTANMVMEELPNSVILTGDGNLWWGGGLHMAYKYLRTLKLTSEDIVFICNDDIDIKEDFLEIGVDLITKHPGYIIQGKGINGITGKVEDGASFRNPITAEGYKAKFGEEADCGATRALFIKGDVYIKIGGMHPILLPHYCSDVEYAIRAVRKGYPCVTYEELEYVNHPEETGLEKSVNLKQTFSKSYMNNPIYKFNFIILVTPWYLLPAYVGNLIKRKISHK